MTWGNPWAWLGMLTIAVPIVIHLLTRRTARVQRFPSLRFLAESRRTAARRIRLHDPLLLAVRVMILATAVTALAQPYFATATRGGDAARVIARAIVLDTSASMRRPAAMSAASDSARAAIEALTIARDSARVYAQAGANVVIETASPGRAVAGATAWLGTQARTRELVIISDFQTGSIDAADIEELPPGVGVHFVKVPVAADTAPIVFEKSSGNTVTTAEVSHTPQATAVAWTSRRAEAPASSLRVIATDADRSRAQATLDAALAAGAPAHTDTMRPVAIVFSRADAPPLQPPNQPWMGDVLAGLEADSLVDAAGVNAIDGREHLLLHTHAEPGSLRAAELLRDVLDALDASPSAGELEPSVIAAETLAQWSRPATAEPGAATSNDSDGRWFWLIALVLLGTETWLRRRRVNARA